jgi:hypothetical protein
MPQRQVRLPLLLQMNLVQLINTILNLLSVVGIVGLIWVIFERQKHLHSKLDHLIEVTNTFDQKEQNNTIPGATAPKDNSRSKL